MSTPKGYSSQEKEDRLSAQFSTVEPIKEHQFGLSVASYSTVQEWATGTVDAGSTASVLVITDCAPAKGDIIYFTGGSLYGTEVRVWEVSGTSVELAETLSAAPSAGDAIQVLRHKSPLVNGSGELVVALSELAIETIAAPMADDKVKMAGALDTSGDVRPIQVDTDGQLQIDVLSSALPAGAATETTLLAVKTAVEAIENTVSGSELQVDVVTSALPTGAATSAAQTDGTQKTQIVDGSGNVIGSTGNALDVNLKTPITVDVSLSQANDSVAVFGSDGAVNRALKTDANGELQIDVLSSALPTGAATETTLVAVKTSVELIDDAVVVDGAAFSGKGLVIAGVTSGGVAQIIETNASGHVHVADGGGSLTVDATSWPLPTGAATESTLSTLNGKVTACNTGAVTISTALPSGANTIGKVDVNTLSVIDLLDAGILDTSSTNINGSASSPTQVVASTAAATKKMQILDTTGAFIGLYTGAAASEVLQLVIGPGSDQTIEHAIPASTRISLKRLDSTTAISSGIVAINFIGG